MTTRQILREDRLALKQVCDAIKALSSDKSEKARILRAKFEELRENLEISIESNEMALCMEQKYAGQVECGKITFVV